MDISDIEEIKQEIFDNLNYDDNKKVFETYLSSDIINSLLNSYIDEFKDKLPEKLEIEKILIDFEEQKIYANCNIYGIYVPLSTQMDFKYDNSDINISFSELKAGNINIPEELINKFISADKLKISMSIRELGLPSILVVKDIYFSQNKIKADIDVDYHSIFVDFTKDINQSVQFFTKLMNDDSRFSGLQALVEYLANTSKSNITEENFKFYFKQALKDKDVVDALFDLILGG